DDRNGPSDFSRHVHHDRSTRQYARDDCQWPREYVQKVIDSWYVEGKRLSECSSTECEQRGRALEPGEGVQQRYVVGAGRESRDQQRHEDAKSRRRGETEAEGHAEQHVEGEVHASLGLVGAGAVLGRCEILAENLPDGRNGERACGFTRAARAV